MATTIMISTSVKPDLRLIFMFSFLVLILWNRAGDGL